MEHTRTPPTRMRPQWTRPNSRRGAGGEAAMHRLFEQPGDLLDGDQGVAYAICKRFWKDAVGEFGAALVYGTTTTERKRDRLIREGRDWWLVPDEAAEICCALLGLSLEAVQDKLRYLINNDA